MGGGDNLPAVGGVPRGNEHRFLPVTSAASPAILFTNRCRFFFTGGFAKQLNDVRIGPGQQIGRPGRVWRGMRTHRELRFFEQETRRLAAEATN